MKIAFHTPQIDVRGTCVAIYDYAHFNETILGNRSVIVVLQHAKNDEEALIRFGKRFEIRFYQNTFETCIEDCDVFYCIKYGKNDGLVSNKVKTVVHCVFDMNEPHGSIYAGVSSTLARKFGQTTFVPHMISLKPSQTKENLRSQLNIPESAIVFGRHGGQDTFNLDFAIKAIHKILNTHSNIWFVFVNTPKYWNHRHVKYIDKIVDLEEKNRFINTCDAHLECSTMGHTFGLSMGEFSVNNKPIIAYRGNLWNTAHLDILGDKAIYFDTEANFIEALTTFNPKVWEKKDNNCYRDYTPEKVMQKFQEVFLI